MSKPPYRNPRWPGDKAGTEYQHLDLDNSGYSKTIDTFEVWAWIVFVVGMVLIYVFAG